MHTASKKEKIPRGGRVWSQRRDNAALGRLRRDRLAARPEEKKSLVRRAAGWRKSGVVRRGKAVGGIGNSGAISGWQGKESGTRKTRQ